MQIRGLKNAIIRFLISPIFTLIKLEIKLMDSLQVTGFTEYLLVFPFHTFL